MMSIMKHRGPDDEGVFIEENVGLGFVRLSIIDLSPAGHQPMFSHDDRYVIVFNGEIFNYPELRDDMKSKEHSFRTGSDTEVLLAAYIEWGEECLHKFNGMWAFVIYDRLEKKIFAARDRYGIKPFYYLQTLDFIAFASEIPPLLSLAEDKPEPDNQSIYDYLVFNRTDQTERTFFTEVKKLQHGHCMSFRIEDSRFKIQSSIKKWYDLRERVSSTEGFNDPSEFRELFSSSVGLRLRSDVPVGVCLSGGLDSSSIVSVLLKDYQKRDLNTFSAVYQKGQSGDESEFISEYTKQVSQMFYTTPTAETLLKDIPDFVRAHGEPIPTTSPYAQFKVMELARQNVVVTLDGQGADEELAGYHYFFGFYFKELLTHFKWLLLLREMSAYFTNHRSLFGLGTFGYFLLPSVLKNKTRVAEKGYLNHDFVQNYAGTNSITSGLYSSGTLHEALLDHFEYKLEHLLKWEDRNSMWFSLEARVPFLDYRLVEKTLALPSEKVIHGGMTKFILREAMKDTLPEKIRTRKDKIGFETPQAEWFRKPGFQKFIFDILNSDSFRSRNLIIPGVAERIYQNHVNGKTDISKEIWKWIHLEMWFREYFDV
jgi:asparagine synthase (glutamine-hydrolysing)